MDFVEKIALPNPLGIAAYRPHPAGIPLTPCPGDGTGRTLAKYASTARPSPGGALLQASGRCVAEVAPEASPRGRSVPGRAKGPITLRRRRI